MATTGAPLAPLPQSKGKVLQCQHRYAFSVQAKANIIVEATTSSLEAS